jgi:diacylglycerol kinase (ATP)
MTPVDIDPITNEKPIRYHPLKTYFYALQGIGYAFTLEKNLWVQLFIGIFSTLIFLANQRTSFAIISLVMMLVVGALELVNTAFEHLCDLVDTNYNERIKRIKDVAAGGVLYAAIGWAVVITVGMLQIIWKTQLQ